MSAARTVFLSVTLRCEAAKLPSLEGRQPVVLRPIILRGSLRSHLKMTARGAW